MAKPAPPTSTARTATFTAALRRPHGPPPVTKNPLSLLQYMRRMRAGATTLVGARFERYGDLYYAPFLGRDVYVLRHPDHIKEVLVTQASKFGKPRSGMTASQLNRLLGEGLLNANGDSWRRRRRLIQPAFRPDRLAHYAKTVARLTDARMQHWRPGARLDISREMMELTLAIVSKALFDHEVSGQTDRVAVAMNSFRDSFGGLEAIFPDWAPVPGKKRILAAIAEIDAIVYGMIDRRGARDADAEDAGDLLSSLVAARTQEDGLSREELRDELLTLFIAGHETTSHALSWTFHLLGKHPKIAERVREEATALGHAPGWDDLPALAYTKQVLEESMRLYPPAYAVPREAMEPAEVGGFTIPVGADVVVWVYHAHRDPRWFAEPTRFDPGRFDAERRTSIPQCAYLPFGAGQRTCIGKQFAMMEAQLILARIAQQWRFRPDPSHRVQAHLSVTMAPKGGLPMFAERAH